MEKNKYKYIYPNVDVFNTSINIEQVLVLICENNGSKFFCPNGHSKPQKIQIYKTPNICKCHNCGEVKGSPVDIAKWYKGDFIEGLKWLSESFGIQKVLNPEYIDEKGQTLSSEELKKAQDSIRALQETIKHEIKETITKIDYLEFDSKKAYKMVKDIKEFLPNTKLWEKLDNVQKLKVVYTWFYRETFAISDGPQKAKYMYYKKRGIDTSNKWLKKISYLSVENFDEIFDKATALFPIEILELVGFVKRNDEKNEFRLSFNYIKQGGILIVPSFDLYTNMVTGFMLRPTHPEKWMKDRHMKEIQLSNTSLIFPIPFGLTYYSLKKFNEFYVTEGHPDGLALPDNGKDEKGRGFFSIPGVNGLNESHLGLLRDKKVIICFDQDRAGQKSAFGYSVIEYNGQRFDFINQLEDKIKNNFMSNPELEFKEIVYQGISSKLEKAEVEYSIKQWDKKMGSDINDIRIYGNLSKIF
ncbi:toprim domain-containing protein (plasmid) [Aliarcobacter lanthieri]|uniref:toprim domain-containing protein n=1 Tax=Aliarcobacter lanthieri TaxID=1355374 RepID=UPI003AAE43FA